MSLNTQAKLLRVLEEARSSGWALAFDPIDVRRDQARRIATWRRQSPKRSFRADLFTGCASCR